jgi:hypothetical protein
VLHRGIATGEFLTNIDALDLHAMTSSYCLFPVANRYTFLILFGRDMLDPARHDYYRRLVGDMIVATMTDRSRPDLSGS